MNPFKQGDTVKLKSGNIEMTVRGVDGDMVDCVWQDGNESYSDEFEYWLLEKVQLYKHSQESENYGSATY